MKPSYALLIATGMILPLPAQTLDIQKKENPISEEVQKAIDEFNRLKNEARENGTEMENEVKIVLPPPSIDEDPLVEIDSLADEAEEKKAILVTGKPPGEEVIEIEESVDLAQPAISDSTESAIEEPSEMAASEAEPNPPIADANEPGLEIRVESIRRGTGILEPDKISLRASFPAKPLASPPSGWKMEKAEDAPAIKRDVELQPGTVISLDIKPHVLLPDADGADTFAINEPGFDALEKYHQSQTVSAILAKSVVQLDEDAKQLGNALSDLQQILASLPSPEPKAIPVEEVNQ